MWFSFLNNKDYNAYKIIFEAFVQLTIEYWMYWVFYKETISLIVSLFKKVELVLVT